MPRLGPTWLACEALPGGENQLLLLPGRGFRGAASVSGGELYYRFRPEHRQQSASSRLAVVDGCRVRVHPPTSSPVLALQDAAES